MRLSHPRMQCGCGGQQLAHPTSELWGSRLRGRASLSRALRLTNVIPDAHRSSVRQLGADRSRESCARATVIASPHRDCGLRAKGRYVTVKACKPTADGIPTRHGAFAEAASREGRSVERGRCGSADHGSANHSRRETQLLALQGDSSRWARVAQSAVGSSPPDVTKVGSDPQPDVCSPSRELCLARSLRNGAQSDRPISILSPWHVRVPSAHIHRPLSEP